MKSYQRGEIAIFITDLQTKRQEEAIMNMLEERFPEWTINFDASSNGKLYPCGHTILRIKGIGVGKVPIKSLVNQLGIRCDLLEDKLCS